MTRLIVISNEKDFEHEVSLVNELFESGMELFHLRKPLWNLEQQRLFLENVKKDFLPMISVHQNHETISEFGLKYFHAKENERKTVVKNDTLIYSTSFHNYNDLQFESHLWNYCFLSPVFDSISKAGHTSPFTNDFHIEGDLFQRVYALGGITKNNVEQVFNMEFYGAAVLGAIWSDPKNAVKNFKEIKDKCKPNVRIR
jgi:thiamine-phosphate pyrophosphorylase